MKLYNFNKKELISIYEKMVTSRFLDDKMLIMLKQGKSWFHIGASGHEAGGCRRKAARGLPLARAVHNPSKARETATRERSAWRPSLTPKGQGNQEAKRSGQQVTVCVR